MLTQEETARLALLSRRSHVRIVPGARVARRRSARGSDRVDGRRGLLHTAYCADLPRCRGGCPELSAPEGVSFPPPAG